MIYSMGVTPKYKNQPLAFQKKFSHSVSELVSNIVNEVDTWHDNWISQCGYDKAYPDPTDKEQDGPDGSHIPDLTSFWNWGKSDWIVS